MYLAAVFHGIIQQAVTTQYSEKGICCCSGNTFFNYY